MQVASYIMSVDLYVDCMKVLESKAPNTQAPSATTNATPLQTTSSSSTDSIVSTTTISSSSGMFCCY